MGELAHEAKCSPRPLAKIGGLAQVDCLGRDEKLDGDDPGGEVGHFGEPPRRERGHCRAVLDPFGLARTHDLERDRVGERTCLCRDRLRGAGELGEGVLACVRLGCQAGREAGDGALEEFHSPFGCGGHHWSKGDAGQVERGGDWYDVEVADRDDAPFSQDDSGIALCGVQLRLDRVPDVGEGVPCRAEDLGDAPEG